MKKRTTTILCIVSMLVATACLAWAEDTAKTPTIEVVGKHPFDNYWYVRVQAHIDEDLSKKLLAELEKKSTARKQRWTTSYSTS